MGQIQWSSGEWINPPSSYSEVGTNFQVRTIHESDFWRLTSYGFVHDSGHGLLIDFPDKSAMEVSFILDYSGQFDQAGILIHSDSEHWIKAGVESADGAPQVGAVVTAIKSDWSLAPVVHWFGEEVTIRASRDGDAITFRARCGDEDLLIRLAPIDPTKKWRAGPHCASPVSAGVDVLFTHWVSTASDLRLH